MFGVMRFKINSHKSTIILQIHKDYNKKKEENNNMNNIICGKAEQELLEFPTNYFDLTITSPPYDALRDYKGFSFDFKTLAQELFRVTAIGGVLVWVVGDSVIKGSETGNSFRQALYFKDVVGYNLHDTMIYEKAGSPFPSSNRYNQIFEYMFVFSKGKPKTVNLIKDKVNKWAGKETFGSSSNRQKDGTLKSTGKRKIKEFSVRYNIWRYANGYNHSQANKLAYQHPATFPEKLVHDHIISWSNPGDRVLDPMCGSGTTLRIAKQLFRNYVGIDVSEEYCNLARTLMTS